MQHAPMSRARLMQESRKMRFEEAYDGWSQGRLTQAEAPCAHRHYARTRQRSHNAAADGRYNNRRSPTAGGVHS